MPVENLRHRLPDRARVVSSGRRLLYVSRRGLLRAGLFGSVTVWAGGLLACVPDGGPRTGARTQRKGLSPAGEEILRAVSPVVLGGLLPETASEREGVLDAGLDGIDEYIAHLSSPLQRELEDLFAALDLLPVRLLLTGSLARWSESSTEVLESFLRSARNSRILLLRRIYALLQSLVVLSFFDQSVAWRSIGYPGPPIATPDRAWGVE